MRCCSSVSDCDSVYNQFCQLQYSASTVTCDDCIVPTNAPTAAPTAAPSVAPSQPPTANPTHAPIMVPSAAPTFAPTRSPSASPTMGPTDMPSYAPSSAPSQPPTMSPTNGPTAMPTDAPTESPTSAPTFAPTVAPTEGIGTRRSMYLYHYEEVENVLELSFAQYADDLERAVYEALIIISNDTSWNSVCGNNSNNVDNYCGHSINRRMLLEMDDIDSYSYKVDSETNTLQWWKGRIDNVRFCVVLSIEV